MLASFFLPIKRDREDRNCFGAFGASTSSNLAAFPKSKEFWKVDVFMGVLYAKCNCLATKACRFAKTQMIINNTPIGQNKQSKLCLVSDLCFSFLGKEKKNSRIFSETIHFPKKSKNILQF